MLAELSAAVRDRRVSAVDLVRASLERIERLNPPLGAVTTLRAEQALEDARAVDALSVLGSEAPLAGLPLLVKDNTDVAGMVTHFGSRTMLDRPPAERSEATVERMVDSGAVIVGRSNIPEFAFQGWTGNDVFGLTRNPWALEWSPGGSSGGAAAALSAGLTPLATASDGGGSTRTPAAFCGLAGLKPTSGMIGRRPIPSWMEVSTQGPLGASVADVKLLLEVMRGRVEGDPTATPDWSYGGGMPKRVLATTRTWDLGPLPAEVETRFRSALDAIDRDLGIPVEEVAPGDVFPGVAAAGGHGGMDWWTTVAIEELEWLGRPFVEAHLSEFSAAFRGEMENALGLGLSDYLAVRRRRFLYYGGPGPAARRGRRARLSRPRLRGLAGRRDVARHGRAGRRRGLQHG